MSEVKPASLREAAEIVDKWNRCRFENSRFSMPARDWLVGAISDSLEASRRAALGQAAEIVQTYLASDSQRAVSWHEVQDCRTAILMLLEKGMPKPSADPQGLEVIDRAQLRCEQCGAFTPRHSPWPRGWFETGVSERYASLTHRIDPEKRRLVRRGSAWCSEHCYSTHRALKAFR